MIEAIYRTLKPIIPLALLEILQTGMSKQLNSGDKMACGILVAIILCIYRLSLKNQHNNHTWLLQI